MSARPKLVQEGTPVHYNNNNEEDGYNNRGYHRGGHNSNGRGRYHYGGRGGYGRGDYGGYGGRDYHSHGQRGYGGRSRGYYGGSGRDDYHGGGRRLHGVGGRRHGGRGSSSSLAARANNNTFPSGPKTTISTRLVIGGDDETAAQTGDDYNSNEFQYDGQYDESQMNQAEYSDHMRLKQEKSSSIKTRLVIGEEEDAAGFENNSDMHENANEMHIDEDDDVLIPSTYNEELHQIERMEGVESLEAKEPLLVMDGPNVAYAYADAMKENNGNHNNKRQQPDSRGLLVAANYFREAGVRVLIVLPAPWFRSKPKAGDANQGKNFSCFQT